METTSQIDYETFVQEIEGITKQALVLTMPQIYKRIQHVTLDCEHLQSLYKEKELKYPTSELTYEKICEDLGMTQEQFKVLVKKYAIFDAETIMDQSVSIAQFDKILDETQAIEKLCNNKNITYKWNTMKYDPKAQNQSLIMPSCYPQTKHSQIFGITSGHQILIHNLRPDFISSDFQYNRDVVKQGLIDLDGVPYTSYKIGKVLEERERNPMGILKNATKFDITQRVESGFEVENGIQNPQALKYIFQYKILNLIQRVMANCLRKQLSKPRFNEDQHKKGTVSIKRQAYRNSVMSAETDDLYVDYQLRINGNLIQSGKYSPPGTMILKFNEDIKEIRQIKFQEYTLFQLLQGLRTSEYNMSALISFDRCTFKPKSSDVQVSVNTRLDQLFTFKFANSQKQVTCHQIITASIPFEDEVVIPVVDTEVSEEQDSSNRARATSLDSLDESQM